MQKLKVNLDDFYIFSIEKAMAHKSSNTVQRFRDCYRIFNKELLHWFPGHMGKGLKQMQQKLKLVDLVIEVHDARIPLTGRNPNFRYTLSDIKPHILVLNKCDLADLKMKSKIEDKLKQDGISHVLFTNCKDQKCRGVRQIIPLAKDLILTSNRFNRSEEREFCLMVIGVPNVGKSSLINALRNKHLNKAKAAQVGAIAGVTRSVQNRIKVSDTPPVFLLDTPGILTPNVQDVESGLRLALCASLQDHLVGPEIIADYLLYLMNKQNNFKYIQLMNLNESTDDIRTVLAKGAIKLGKSRKIRNINGGYVEVPDLENAANYFIKEFRTGKLGPIMLDMDQITQE